jgi:nucleotide-binding universal stress UspA family protein
MRPLSFQVSDWALAQEIPAPLLLVRGPRWQTPARMAAAVDVSDKDHLGLARSILQTAGFLALGTHGHLDILYTEREAQDESIRMERAVTLAQLVREFHVGSERLQMFGGEPGKRLPPLFAARHYDVLVLGGETRREGLSRLLPGTVARIMDATDSDVVLVKAPAAQAACSGAEDSARQKRPHQRQQFA